MRLARSKTGSITVMLTGDEEDAGIAAGRRRAGRCSNWRATSTPHQLRGSNRGYRHHRPPRHQQLDPRGHGRDRPLKRDLRRGSGAAARSTRRRASWPPSRRSWAPRNPHDQPQRLRRRHQGGARRLPRYRRRQDERHCAHGRRARRFSLHQPRTGASRAKRMQAIVEGTCRGRRRRCVSTMGADPPMTPIPATRRCSRRSTAQAGTLASDPSPPSTRGSRCRRHRLHRTHVPCLDASAAVAAEICTRRESSWTWRR